MHNMIELLKYGLEYCGLYYGTYRAQVKSTADPENRGRIMLLCPQVHGPSYPPVWAEPKSAMAGSQFGFWHVPDVGEWVYVQFDHGRSDFPIWEGGWWGLNDQTADMVTSKVVLATKEGLKLVFDRANGTILVSHPAGSSIQLDDTGIIVAGESVSLVASTVIVSGDTTFQDNITCSTGATGVFTTSTGSIVTVQDGIVVDIT